MTTKDFSIRQYQPEDRMMWNERVACSRNATFLFNRDYMDYHSDRFKDNSLIAMRNDKPVALLPAEISSDGILHSHRGLTYGGWILSPKHFNAVDMMYLFDDMIQWCRAEGIQAIDYKPLPSIYALAPSECDIYALWRKKAACTECNISATIDIRSNPGLNMLRRRKLNQSIRMGVEVEEISKPEEIAEFHKMLTACLAERHDAVPVHSLAELLLLKQRFPQGIRFFVAKLNGEIHAGTCIYDFTTVRHSQYICTTADGRKNNLLTPLTVHLLSTMLEGQRYFDFGTSNEDSGRILNEGLYENKASYGATGIVYQRFRLDI